VKFGSIMVCITTLHL